MPDLILASTSPYRRALLERLGIPFLCVPPDVDENEFKSLGLGPRALAERLSLVKAEAVARLHPESLVLGGDQVATIDGHVLDKPGTVERAIDQLMILSGREHELITSIALIASGRVYTHTDVTTLAMRPLDHDALARYVAADMPLDCAGSYKLESRGISLFERVTSDDSTSVTGLPLIAVTSLLLRLGLAIP